MNIMNYTRLDFTQEKGTENKTLQGKPNSRQLVDTPEANHYLGNIAPEISAQPIPGNSSNRLSIPPARSVSGLCDFGDWTDRSVFRYLYLPIGATILVVRLLLLFGFSLLFLPLSRMMKCKAYQIVLWAMGIQIKRNMNEKQIEQHTKGAVTALNHTSVFDFFIALTHPNATIILVHTPGFISQFLIPFFLKAAGVGFWRINDKRQLAQSLMQWRKAPEAMSLSVTPEGTISNGRGVFTFRPDFIARGFPVVPTAISVKTPLGVSAHPALASGSKRFFRLFMMPWMKFDVAYLDKLTQQKGQSKEDFAREVQETVAKHLGVPATRWSAEDKHEYIRAIKFGQGPGDRA